MAPVSKPVVTVQVRELVEFVLRGGDLGGGRDFVGPGRALAGIRGHQQVQHSRPKEYQREVRISHDIETEEFILRVQGRIDGLQVNGNEVLIEEIKTVQAHWDGVTDPLHWAQAKFYGFMYSKAHGRAALTLLLTYFDLNSGKNSGFQQAFAAAELSAFFEATTAIYLEWVRENQRWRRQRDESIRGLAFPFGQYRPGQRELAVAAYRALARAGRLFVEAPTGIGKTVSVLFPAMKAMGEGRFERIFYLTARTSGRLAAEQALNDLRQAGLRARTLTLTAKEKVCVQDGRPCDPATCPLARGYYDRRKAAMRAALAREQITRSALEMISREHQVCPFELSLDLSSWVDVVICDYNYVFDPKVYLRRHFAEEGANYAFLVDEAHNLVDRGREMFSAELSAHEIREVSRMLRQPVPRCARALNKLAKTICNLCDGSSESSSSSSFSSSTTSLELSRTRTMEPARLSVRAQAPPASTPFLFESLATVAEPSSPASLAARRASEENGAQIFTSTEVPPALLGLLDRALEEAEGWLAQNRPAEFRENLLGLYFRLYSFRRTAELFDERYVLIAEPGDNARVRLFCLDPSFLVRQALARGKAAIFFSATLTPLDYYRSLLGGAPEDPELRLASPFPPENLALLVQDRIRTDFKGRGESIEGVVESIAAVVRERPGNYLVFFPSYQYLGAVLERFQNLHPAVRVLSQRPGMSETERDEFLASFSHQNQAALAGFVVMGGIFGEGIDLVGDRLIGAIIVGVGLPQLCVERDLIRDYFQRRRGAGFDYAYTFPGMNRVLQAAGRVIRSERDRGVVLLVDSRFAEPRYRRLFPRWWQYRRVRGAGQIQAAIGALWPEEIPRD